MNRILSKSGAVALLALKLMRDETGNVMHHQWTAGRIIEDAAVVGGEPSVELLVGVAAQFRKLLLKLGSLGCADLRPEHSGLPGGWQRKTHACVRGEQVLEAPQATRSKRNSANDSGDHITLVPAFSLYPPPRERHS